MMKFVKMPSKAFRKDCERCGCIFEYELSDVNQRDSIGEQDTVKCPGCGKEMAHHGKWDSVEYNDEIEELDF